MNKCDFNHCENETNTRFCEKHTDMRCFKCSFPATEYGYDCCMFKCKDCKCDVFHTWPKGQEENRLKRQRQEPLEPLIIADFSEIEPRINATLYDRVREMTKRQVQEKLDRFIDQRLYGRLYWNE